MSYIFVQCTPHRSRDIAKIHYLGCDLTAASRTLLWLIPWYLALYLATVIHCIQLPYFDTEKRIEYRKYSDALHISLL